MAKLNGYAIGAVSIGSLMVYAGITGRSVLATVQAIIQGKAPNTAAVSQQIFSGTNAPAVPTPALGSTPAVSGAGGSDTNQAIARQLAMSMGHADWITGQNWTDWVALWNKESGWSQFADTRKSGLDPANASVFAYGIPQARPYSKMPQSGWPSDKGGQSSAGAQIQWGIEYIASTYGSPSAAWAHEQANNWY